MLHYLLVVLYFGVLLGLSAYGLHRLHLVILCWRHKEKIAEAQVMPTLTEDELPIVTIQLPLFNESTVAARLLDAV
ncbi:MAG: glycosyltransferase, partial [Polyangiaceae bacterium]|nr:glycosyltransferase [Polyangiaceae bacterium]